MYFEGLESSLKNNLILEIEYLGSAREDYSKI